MNIAVVMHRVVRWLIAGCLARVALWLVLILGFWILTFSYQRCVY